MRQLEARRQRSGEPLWRFSLAFYSRPGVAEALLRLQDQAGHDVNLILFCLWVGAVGGRRLDRAGLSAIEAAVQPLAAEVVGPLRTLRRRLKGAPDGDLQQLRRRLAALELAAERCGLARLAELAESYGLAAEDRLAAARFNLALYLGAESHSPEAALLHRTLAGLARRD